MHALPHSSLDIDSLTGLIAICNSMFTAVLLVLWEFVYSEILQLVSSPILIASFLLVCFTKAKHYRLDFEAATDLYASLDPEEGANIGQAANAGPRQVSTYATF